MNPLSAIILSNLFLILIWATYELLLSRSLNFQANRFFLLAGSVLSVILPWLPWQVHFASARIFTLPMVTITEQTFKNLPAAGRGLSVFETDPAHMVAYIYLFAVMVFLLISASRLIQMYIWTWTRPVVKLKGHRIVVLNKSISAFSFFRTIFFPAPFNPEDKGTQIILNHEKVHARQFHSLDNLLLLILRALYFYNPAVYLISKKLQLTHEFIADEASAGLDKYGYSQVLIDHQFSVSLIRIVHSFNNQSYLKRRLKMLSKNNSKHPASWKYLLAAPLLGGMVVLCGWTASAQNQVKKTQGATVDKGTQTVIIQTNTSAKQDTTVKPAAKKSQIKFTPPKIKKEDGPFSYSAVDIKPEFPGGDEGILKWIKENTKYPAEAVEKKIAGKVFVGFVISKTGEVKNAKVLRSVQPLLDAEALRVVNSMPKWTPGSQAGKPVDVSYQIPINFTLN